MLLAELNLLKFFWLLVAHGLGDFSFQHGLMAENKRDDPWTMWAHCLVWTGCLVLVLQAFGDFQIWHLPFLFFGHLLIDSFKPRFSSNPHFRNSIDQALHLAQLLIIWL